MPDPARVALIGYGLGGSVFHAPLIATTPGLSLDVIVTSDASRQASARERYPRTRVITDVGRLLTIAGDLDLAVVSVPNAAHFSVAEALLSAGLPAVVDKPVTPTSREARRLEDLAFDRGVSVIPYHNRRWDGDFLTAAELIGSGRLGEIWRFESRFERWRPGALSGAPWKHDLTLPGGGILFDLGSHLIDQAIYLFGVPRSVYAELRAHGRVPDNDAFVALSYGDRLVVHLWASSTAAQLGPRFRVLGAQGSYLKYGLDPQEDALRAGRLPTEPGWGEELAEAWGKAGSVGDFRPVPTRPGAYQMFYRGVAEHLISGAPPPVRSEDAIAGLEVIEAALASAASTSVVALDRPSG
jgi:predicted dehydrogenase